MGCPRYSIKASRALGFLKSSYNDIEIYVEDTKGHNIHLLLCRKILGDAVKLTSINQIGPRNDVIAACRLDQHEDGRRRLYIIDGDLDLIAKQKAPSLKFLHRLRAYCVENILISEAAVTALCMLCSPNENELQISAKLNFKIWFTGVTRQLGKLFNVYGAAHSSGCGVQTVAYSVVRLSKSSSMGLSLDSVKINSRASEVIRDASSTHKKVFAKKLKDIEAYTKSNPHLVPSFISGKDYLLPLLHSRLGKLFGWRGTTDQLKAHLASNYDPKNEPQLARRLTRGQ